MIETTTHAALLTEFLNGADLPEEQKDLARRFQALPLYLDFMGFFGLRRDGSLTFVPWEPPFELQPVDARMRHVALVQGAARYPELECLRPVRQSDDVVCPSCGGYGRPGVDGKDISDKIVCECGGSGWLPAELARNTPDE